MLSVPVTLKRFEPVTRRTSKLFQRTDRIYQEQLAARLSLKGAKTSNGYVIEQRFRVLVSETPDHV